MIAKSPEIPVPLSFLLDASRSCLQDLELASLNRSANLGKAVRSELEQWITQCATAMLARWLIDNRDTLLSRAETPMLETIFSAAPDSVR